MTPAAPPDPAYASGRWEALGTRLRSMTPEFLGRASLAVLAFAVAMGVVVGTWPALAPFAAGAVIAYAVLPIANALDRVMPRVLAALVAEVLAVAALIAIVIVVVPPVVNGLTQVAARIPPPDQVEARLADLQAQLGTLPEPARSVVLAVATDVAASLQAAIDGFVEGLAGFVTSQILGVLETASFLLGLLVVPVWILTVVADERRIKRRALATVAPGIRADVYAMFRIVDRSLKTFLRVQVVQAVAVGGLVWAGIQLAEAIGLADLRYDAAAAVILGMFQVIPQLGFLLGFLPLLLVLAVSGPVPFAVMVVVYIAANRLAGTLVSSPVSRGVLDVHPALMIPGLVAIGQLGLVPLLAGAPLIVIARDSVRYLNGRMSEPPKPANVLPGERGWDTGRRTRSSAQAAPAAVPAVYRAPAARTPAPSTVTAGAPAPAQPPFVPSVYRRLPATPVVATRPTPATEGSSIP
ncbi:MAG TPA: AI-2E family transporter [Candidatus Limnocylindrales bacterium]|nr:AI-2E family transporter [Candidatus Limnocylindrales bacterium]